MALIPPLSDGTYPPLTLESYVARSRNFLERMLDAEGLPYFNVFWTTPAEAVHDWPDFGDLTARYLEGAVMLRHLTGTPAITEGRLRERFISSFARGDGLLYRPASPYCTPCADLADQALALCTLYALAAGDADATARSLATAMVRTLDDLAVKADDYAFYPGTRYLDGAWIGRRFDQPGQSFDLMLIRPLVRCAIRFDLPRALDLADKLVLGLFDHSAAFAAAGSFGGHTHSRLRGLAGALDWALQVGDGSLVDRVDAAYLWYREQSTAFGFMPEVTLRDDDVVGCETCTIMDDLDLAILLARSGHPTYWADVERIARNHLIESQVDDVGWLPNAPARVDADGISYRDVGDRQRGGYAGWSSPNHILAYDEELPARWPQGTADPSRLLGKVRAMQNCCGGSGIRAFFQIWRSAAEFRDGVLWVHLHLDKALPEAEIRGGQPYCGWVRITPRTTTPVAVRAPDFVASGQLRANLDGEELPVRLVDGYVRFDAIAAGATVEVSYPLPIRSEEVTIGNPGHQNYRYRVTWKGDTVVEVLPLGNPTGGHTRLLDHPVRLYYGTEGPGPLYQRHWLLAANAAPNPAPLQIDTGSIALY